jgi:uncharacterized OB-fold protein
MSAPRPPGDELPTPTPAVEPDTEPYWRGAGRGGLVLPRCRADGEYVWIPRASCPRHPRAGVDWVAASGHGVIYSWTLVRRGDGAYAGREFVLAYVELAEGPRVLTNIVDAAPGNLRIGDPVEVVFHQAEDGIGVPRFRPATGPR